MKLRPSKGVSVSINAYDFYCSRGFPPARYVREPRIGSSYTVVVKKPKKPE